MGDAYVVYHGTKASPKDFEAAAGAEAHDVTVWRSADELLAGRSIQTHPAVLLADEAMVDHLGALRDLPAHVIVIAADEAAGAALGQRADVSLVGVDDPVAKSRVLDAARKLALSRLRAVRLAREIEHIDEELHELARIGMALMHERDRSALLELIVSQGKQLTGSDGAGLLFLRRDEHGVAELYPVAYEIDTRPDLGLPSITFAVDGTSIVGHAALIKQPVVVDDVLKLPADTTYVASEEFQRRFNYSARSMLAVPMLTQRDDVLGVLFFINRKSDPRAKIESAEDADRYVLPYTQRQVRLACALASEAAVSIENSQLYHQIEHMLESIVTAAVSAVDARDPTTAGHSLRVAALTIALAEAVDRTSRGPYRDMRFTRAQMRELRFAALLHDLGKVTVREDVLVKAKKLPPVLWERVQSRFELIRRTIQLEHCARRADRRDIDPRSGEEHLADELRELDRMREIVRAANEPTVLETPMTDALVDIASRTFEAGDGVARYLTGEELAYLQLARGTLNDSERAEIEAHVEHTRRFLAQIPWTEDLKNLVVYAYGHHEKLNGTGYPLRLRSDDIPVQTRMITLADIFDALTEGDRPYKPALTPDKAIDIIRSEANAGQLDRDLVEIMTESGVYMAILGTDWHQL